MMRCLMKISLGALALVSALGLSGCPNNQVLLPPPATASTKLFVADGPNHTIDIFPIAANGNVAPTATFARIS